MANYKNSPTNQLDEDKTPKVSRNWHDRSHRNVTSLPVGREVPIMMEFLQGNSKVKLDIDSAVQTAPTASPVFAPMTVSVKSIFCALRHYVVGLYGNNLLENDFVEEIQFPMANHQAERSYCIGHGSLLAHLRYPRQVYLTEGTYAATTSAELEFPLNRKARLVPDLFLPELTEGEFPDYPTPYGNPSYLSDYNVLPILAYIDACLHYSVDPFDRIIPFERATISLDGDGAVSVDRSIYGVEYDSLMNLIYESKGFSVPGVPRIDQGEMEPVFIRAEGKAVDGRPISLFYNTAPEIFYNDHDFSVFTDSKSFDQIAQLTFNDGLFPVTFKPDLFTSWYDDEQVNKLTSVTFDNGNYTGLRLAQAEYNRLANNLIKGQTYEDYVDTTYGYELKMCDHPILVGSDSYQIRFQDIVNTAQQTGQQEVPLGAAVARGYASSNINKTIEFTSQEPGFLLVLASLVPNVSYREDVPRHLQYAKLGDTPNRFYDGASFENLLAGNCYHTCVSDIDTLSMGSQPFYYHHMISYDRVSGLLATDGFLSYSFVRDFDVSALGKRFSDTGNVFTEGDFVDAFRSKYVNGTQFDYAFPAQAPVSLGNQYEAIANATAQNYYFVFYFDLRVLEPLTNQVIARATF